MSERTRLRRGGPSARDRRVLFVLHAAVVVACAYWVRTLAIPSAGAAVLGQLAAAFVAVRGRRWLSAISSIAVAAAVVLLVVRDVQRLEDRVRMTVAGEDARTRPLERAVATSIHETQLALANAAAAAAAGSAAPNALPPLASDVGLIVYSSDSAVSWAGRTAVPTFGLWERSGLVITPLYVVQYATALRGARRAVATNVIAAEPPADRLSRAITDVINERFGGTARFSVGLASDTSPAMTRADIGGIRLDITARVTDPAAYDASREQETRLRATLILLIANLVSLATLWRSANGIGERLAAMAIPLAALAITPLNALSNATRLFDPATYYVGIGGPFTASVGALALTSALVLFGVMAAVRARRRSGRRWGAVLGVVAIAALGPFLLRVLAEGINVPPNGTGTSLWIAWEVALFLAATSLLAAGVGAGQFALGRWRGLPLWVPAALAALAALLGPALIAGSARWPDWYPLLWVAAIAALALARRSRAIVFASAFVAACGATVLLWGAVLRERIDLANRDVKSLAVVDPSVLTLLERFADDISRGPEPKTKEQLIARYAAADLASVEYPVALGSWPADSVPTLLTIAGDGRLPETRDVVDSARATGRVRVQQLSPNPAAALVMAVPHPSGTVFTAVVGAATRLSRPPGFAELYGLSETPVETPYHLSIASPTTFSDSSSDWRRRGEHLHSEWRVPSGAIDTVHVVADVSFDSYGTMLSHGLLIVLLDLGVVMVLLIGELAANGVLARWIRARSGLWRRSYRLKLSLALFGFFVVPALAFALWSYQRLQDDDRSARELLARETLRRAVVVRDTFAEARVAPNRSRRSPLPVREPDVTGIPIDVPYFVFRNGQLVNASDSLLNSLAPIGRWLIPSVMRAFANADQAIATATVPIGDRDMLFGFRLLTPNISVAVPARRDEIALDKRRRDLGVLVILATVLGGMAALFLSGIASRNLARPIGTLRDAALAVAGGSREPLNARNAPAEFVPVFSAFDRMARDLAESEAQLARAERVFAWGEVARQVAHEIKNPLTPIRLGVQHLLRAWRDKSPTFGTVLEENSARVLREIDHLDATARSFSQFGTMPGVPETTMPVDVAGVVHDVASFEALGTDSLAWRATGTDGPRWARARARELRDVLLNLCENARNAGARAVELRVDANGERVIISVIDDGEGIAPHLRERVFEPHFSTRTSGSGLGLAISRRLVEGWGGKIELESEPGRGTTVRILLHATDGPGA